MVATNTTTMVNYFIKAKCGSVIIYFYALMTLFDIAAGSDDRSDKLDTL